jgi:hypothetical protein
MDLIDRYVHEVGLHIPWRMRRDVEAELRSLLTESLEDRATAEGRPADAALAAEALRQFGRPADVAARYAPPQYLIGPRLFPAYRTSVAVMVSVLAAITLVLLAVGVFGRGENQPLLGPVARAGASLMNSLLFNLGVLTAVFALVEHLRANAAHTAAHTAKSWNPAALPPVEDPDRISFLGRLLLLYAIAALVLVFNIYPQWVAVVAVRGSDVQVYPLLGPGFSRYLPVLNLWWAAAFVLNLAVLRHGRWGMATRWAEFVLETGNVVILAVIVLGPPAFAYDMLAKLVLQAFAVVALFRAGSQLASLLRRRHAGEPRQTGFPA